MSLEKEISNNYENKDFSGNPLHLRVPNSYLFAFLLKSPLLDAYAESLDQIDPSYAVHGIIPASKTKLTISQSFFKT